MSSARIQPIRRRHSCRTSCPWIRPFTGPILRAGSSHATVGRISAPRLARTPGPFRSLRTSTVPPASATRAMAMRRRGTWRGPGTFPGGFATEGTWYEFFKGKAATRDYIAPGTTAWEPGTAVFQYPNSQHASTIWYHDHTLGMTRLNVYAGPAGFFLIRGGPGDEVRDSRTGRPAILPGPAPGHRRCTGDDLLRGPAYRGPGPRIQRGRLVVLPGHSGVLRRDRRSVHSEVRRLADLEPRILRQHHHGERCDVAVSDGGTAPVPGSAFSMAAIRNSSSSNSRTSQAWRSGRSGTRAGSCRHRSI